MNDYLRDRERERDTIARFTQKEKEKLMELTKDDRVMNFVKQYEQDRLNKAFLYKIFTTIGTITVILLAVKTGLGDLWSWIKASFITGMTK